MGYIRIEYHDIEKPLLSNKNNICMYIYIYIDIDIDCTFINDLCS